MLPTVQIFQGCLIASIAFFAKEPRQTTLLHWGMKKAVPHGLQLSFLGCPHNANGAAPQKPQGGICLKYQEPTNSNPYNYTDYTGLSKKQRCDITINYSSMHLSLSMICFVFLIRCDFHERNTSKPIIHIPPHTQQK